MMDIKKPLSERGFFFCPAGVEKYSDHRVQLSMLKRVNKNPKTIFGRGFKQWYLKDRVVTMTTSSRVSTRTLITPQDIVLPIMGPTYVRNCGLKRVLVNPIHGSFVSEGFDTLGLSSIIDSGGFQLFSGLIDFVSPDDVVTRYNKGGTIGMCLDLPVKHSVAHMFFDVASRIMKANDEYIKPKLTSGIELAIISHGGSIDDRERRLNTLDREDAKVVAIAGVASSTSSTVYRFLNGIENLMYVITRFRKTAEYFHVLGVTSKLWMFIYALLAHRNYVKAIGSDSVSYRIGAASGNYLEIPFTTKTLNRYSKAYGQVPSCPCPVCNIAGDIRLLGDYRMLESHNLWVLARQSDFVDDVARFYCSGDINLAEVHEVLNVPVSIQDFTLIITYLEGIIATDKFKLLRKTSKGSSLFAETPEPVDPKVVNFYKGVVKKYEEFHGQSFMPKGKKK